jgi:hypothetical protein
LRRIERFLDVVWVVRVVPELGGDEEFLAGDARLLDGIAHSSFCAVDARSIDMAVSSLDRYRYSSAMRLV